MLTVITKLTLIKSLPSCNNNINSEDRSPNTSSLATNIN